MLWKHKPTGVFPELFGFGHTYHDLDTSFNPFRSKSDLIDFTLSNARQFYSSKGPLGVKGLKFDLL